MDHQKPRRSRLKKQVTKNRPDEIFELNGTSSIQLPRPSKSDQQLVNLGDKDAYTENPVFRRYWDSVNAANFWIQRHREYVQQTNSKRPDSIWFPPPPPPPPLLPTTSFPSVKTGSSGSQLLKSSISQIDLERNLDSDDGFSSSDKIEYSIDEMVDEEETKMDLSDDMLAFMTQTIKHRIEREKKKAEEEALQETTVIFVPADRPFALSRINEFGGDASAVAEMLRKGGDGEMTAAERRRQQMIDLYGSEAAARIQAQEIIMQMKFDQEYDKFHPPFWPNIPLKL